MIWIDSDDIWQKYSEGYIDREHDSLLSAIPFNIIYFHCIIVSILFVFRC